MNANQPHQSFSAQALGTWLLVEPTSTPVGPGPCEGYVRSVGPGETVVLPNGSETVMPPPAVLLGDRVLFFHHSARRWENFCIVADTDLVAVLTPITTRDENLTPMGSDSKS